MFILPALLMMVLAAHIMLFRRHGVTPRWGRKPEDLKASTESFWPPQLTYDLIFVSAVIAVLAYLSIRHHGAPLAAPARSVVDLRGAVRVVLPVAVRAPEAPPRTLIAYIRRTLGK